MYFYAAETNTSDAETWLAAAAANPAYTDVCGD
jgi:hypothetical protein